MEAVRFKILIVEDDPDDRFIIDEAFKIIHYENEVKKVIDGEQLLHYLEKISPACYPSLLVLDNALPRLDAADVLDRLKENPAYKDIPVIVYSTEMSPGRKERLMAQGAFACIKKGVRQEELIAVAMAFRAIAEGDNPHYTVNHFV